jgi:phytoene dehydrogenase-like protein
LPSNSPHDHMILREELVGSHGRWVMGGTAGVEAPQNVVLVSIASVLDPSLAPAGKHVIHAYTPGSEPYAPWAGLERNSPEYKLLKEQRSQVFTPTHTYPTLAKQSS